MGDVLIITMLNDKNNVSNMLHNIRIIKKVGNFRFIIIDMNAI